MTTAKTITNAWVERTLPDIFYEEPEIAEDALVQERTLDRIKMLLRQLYDNKKNIFIAGMVYIAYDINNGNRRVQPDCFIAFDVDAEAIRYNLPNYWVWEVGKVPDFVMEVASTSTAANDLGHKRDLYEALGVTEYWRFDPTGGDLYGQPVTGERLVDGEYHPYPLYEDTDGAIRAYSELLDLEFCYYADDDEFDVLDPVTGKTIDQLVAEREAHEATQEELEAERNARLAAEARLAEREMRLAQSEARQRALLAEIERLRSGEA